MTGRNFDSVRSFFRCPAWAFFLLFSVFAALLAAALLYAENDFNVYTSCVQRGDLTSAPVSEKDDAAVRWDHRCRTGLVWRLSKRSNSRLISFPPQTGAAEPLTRSCTIQFTDQQKCFDFINIAYYRRLWQKIFPTRAGPPA